MNECKCGQVPEVSKEVVFTSYMILCECGEQGPSRDTVAEAIAAWDAGLRSDDTVVRAVML